MCADAPTENIVSLIIDGKSSAKGRWELVRALPTNFQINRGAARLRWHWRWKGVAFQFLSHENHLSGTSFAAVYGMEPGWARRRRGRFRGHEMGYQGWGGGEVGSVPLGVLGSDCQDWEIDAAEQMLGRSRLRNMEWQWMTLGLFGQTWLENHHDTHQAIFLVGNL